MNAKKIFWALLLLWVVAACQKDENLEEPDDNNHTTDQPYNPAKDQIVADKKEIRAAWIATVFNLDWPLTKNNAEAQKAELTATLTKCKELNFNAVIMQIRPMADAFYPSSLEPWSAYLTGTQGVNPGYDPLQFAIDEAHRLGMEFHAWLNPYRVGPAANVLAPEHVALKNPSWIVTFEGNNYFNPGMPEVRAHLGAVVKDIITRYAVDAIHFDDYFYPSGAKSATNPYGFNDQAAYEKYGNGATLDNWRSANVNTMVREISELIRTFKPSVLFGISPSGRRENSMALYADPYVWLENKWVDYLAPQIYWEYGHATADFYALANQWHNNAHQVPIVIGVAAYKFKDAAYPAFGTTDEFARQINLTRTLSNLHGCFFYRMKSLENSELFSFLKNIYPYKSLLPLMGRPSGSTPLAPTATLSGTQINWSTVAGATKYIVYQLERDKTKANTFKSHAVEITTGLSFTAKAATSYYVTSANNDQQESLPSLVITLP